MKQHERKIRSNWIVIFKLLCLLICIYVCQFLYSNNSKPDNDCSHFQNSAFKGFQTISNALLSNIVTNTIKGTKSNSLAKHVTHKRIIAKYSPSNPCQSRYTLLIVVKSSANHAERRLIIRKTWGGRNEGQYITYFAVGRAEKDEFEPTYEFKRYNDIILGDFVDTYRNNTFKTIMTYRWIHMFCPHIPYVLLVDDDYYVNTKKVLESVENKFTYVGCPMYGQLIKNWHPVRLRSDPNSFITHTEYPFKCFPDYLSGGSILTCINTIKIISTAIPYVRAFSLDDVYIGIITSLLNIKLIHEPQMTIHRMPFDQAKELLAVHGASDNDLLSVL